MTAARTEVTKRCEYCGKEFTRPAWKMKVQRFCSPSCARKAHPPKHRTTTEIVCKNCGKTIKLPYWYAKRRQFCSAECANQFSKGKKRRPGLRGKDNPRHKSRQIKEGRKVMIWNDENKLVYEHRDVMEKVIGRKLKTNEIVHHVNCDPLDNRPENLSLMTKGEHLKAHFSSNGLLKELMERTIIKFNEEEKKYELT